MQPAIIITMRLFQLPSDVTTIWLYFLTVGIINKAVLAFEHCLYAMGMEQ